MQFKAKWFRFEVREIDGVEPRDVECALCGQDFDGSDVCVSRGNSCSDEPVFCCTGCGVVYEREQAKDALVELEA